MANYLITPYAKNNRDPTPGSPMLGLSQQYCQEIGLSAAVDCARVFLRPRSPGLASLLAGSSKQQQQQQVLCDGTTVDKELTQNNKAKGFAPSAVLLIVDGFSSFALLIESGSSSLPRKDG
ncbi:hypothetical protein PoB_007560900 [Plakobranchus ocellatus]|uniref:Uncharacterized protein n=1 Tax=Plakobranchus ocellatus TaxID=259542 RepID=A0AAV4DY33_9GAST|nr:hypothetical protein PoB_007560900 [Plakobranchus ocellatus]